MGGCKTPKKLKKIILGGFFVKKKIVLVLVLCIAFVSIVLTVLLLKKSSDPTFANLPDIKNAPVIKVLTRDSTASNRTASGFDIKDNPYVQYIFKHTGINVQLQLQPQDSYTEKLQLELASQNAPDLAFLTGNDSYALNIAKSGALEPLNNYIDKYPNIQIVYDDNYWKEYSFDKNKYFLKGPYILPVGNKCTLIRQDWLDKLNLKMPTTVDELHEVLKAFVKAKPDGQTPTYGLTARKDLSNFYTVSSAYGNPSVDSGLPYIYVDYAKKKLALWNTSEAVREYYKEMVKWWKEGLIDKECLTASADQFWNKILTGNIGIVSHNAESAGWLTTWIRQVQKKTNPVLAVMPALKGTGFKNPYGTEGGLEKTRSFEGYLGIPKGSKNIDNVLKVINFECSPDFNNFAIFGAQGYEYNTKNGGLEIDTNYMQTKTFSAQYVFSFDKSSFTGKQEEYTYLLAGGFGDKNYDSEADVLARTKKAFSISSAYAVPYQNWISIIPRLPIEDMYPDIDNTILSFSIKLVTGELNANSDEDWKTYLKAVDNSGLHSIIKEKEKYLKKNAPGFFDRSYIE